MGICVERAQAVLSCQQYMGPRKLPKINCLKNQLFPKYFSSVLYDIKIISLYSIQIYIYYTANFIRLVYYLCKNRKACRVHFKSKFTYNAFKLINVKTKNKHKTKIKITAEDECFHGHFGNF